MLPIFDLRLALLLAGATLLIPAAARSGTPVTGDGKGPDGTITPVETVPEKKPVLSEGIYGIGSRVKTATERDEDRYEPGRGGNSAQTGWFNRQLCSGPQAANNPLCANKMHGSGVGVDPNNPDSKKFKRPPPVADPNQGTLTGTWTGPGGPGNPGNANGTTDTGPTGQPGSYNGTTWTPGKASQYYTNQINNGAATSDDYYGRAHARWSQGDAVGARQDAVQALNMDPSNGSAMSLYKLTDRQIADPKLKALKPDFGMTSAESAGGTPGGGGGPGAAARPGGASAPAGDDDGGFGAYGGSPGDVSYGRGDPASVARALNAAAGQPPREQSRSLTRAAIAAYRVKDQSAVLALTEQALKLDPANIEAYSVRSMAQLQAKNYAASAAEATKGLAIDPRSRPLLNRRALAYNRMGRYREGLADALSALRLSPRDAMGYYNKSYAEAGLGNGKAAREDLKLAATLEPRFRKQYEAMVRLPDDSMLMDLYDAAAGEEGGGAKEGEPAPARKSLPWWPFLAAGAALLAFGALRSLAMRDRTSVLLRRGAEAEDAAAVAMTAGPAQVGTGFWSRYELVKELGAGGMGLVYLAKDQRLDRLVAVKKMRDEIRSNRRERERFLKEAQTVAKLRHPGIVEIYSIEEDGDDAYLVFEYVAGRTLYDLIQEKGRLSLREALDLLRGVCYALEYAHGRNVIHRDLKPSNIMVDADRAVKVMDFGIARQVTDALARQSMTNTVIGTPPYMAPEQEQGVVRRESDIYSLGVCLYEALSGELPFGGTPGAALLSKLEGKYIPVRKLVDGLPEGAESLIRRALTPDPEKRIKSAAEFLQELEKAAA